MARGRMLNKTVCASKKFDDLPDDTCRLLATWTISNLDCQGVFYCDPAMVRSYVFPRRIDVTLEDIERHLLAMEEVGLIEIFYDKGDIWQYWPGFPQNQVGLRADRETKDFPDPAAAIRKQSGIPLESFRNESRISEVKRSEVEVKLSEVEVNAPPPPRPNAFVVYEKSIGQLTQTISAIIGDSIDACEAHRTTLPLGTAGSDIDGDAWVSNAIIEGVTSSSKGAPNIKYIQSILDRWRTDGYKSEFVYHGPAERIVPKHTEVFS